ncbi:MAG: hypothetical protein JXO51_11750, partial [Candidatus Aminicenantes bacterium]|nr:hypothetical protein [Candidatus Aminicenantes bacterium]
VGKVTDETVLALDDGDLSHQYGCKFENQTQGDEHLKELESLVLRISMPKGNRVTGKFMNSRDLFKLFRHKVQLMQRRELFEITGNEAMEISKDKRERRRRGEFDTIVCPAHPDGFEKEFLRKNCWWAIRLSKRIIPHLKYIAIYVTSPGHQITHYGRIASIRPYRDSGKYIVKLRGKAKAIGPIAHSPGITMQGSRLCFKEKLKNSRTIAEAFR